MPHGKFSFNAHGQDSNLAHGMSLILRVCTRTLTNPWHRFGPTVDEEVREDHRRSERQSHAEAWEAEKAEARLNRVCMIMGNSQLRARVSSITARMWCSCWVL